MAFQEVAATYQLKIGWLLNGTIQAYNIVNFRKQGLGIVTAADLEAGLDGAINWAINEGDLGMGSHCLLNSLSAKALDTELGPTRDWTGAGLPVAGATTGNPLPTNVAFCLKLGTGLIGRSQRGRIYCTGLVDTQVTDNTISVAAADTLVDKFESLRNLMDLEGSANMVVVSRYHEGELRSAGITQVVTAISYTDRLVDTQRRRLS